MKTFLVTFAFLLSNFGYAAEKSTFSCENIGMGDTFISISGSYESAYDVRLASITFKGIINLNRQSLKFERKGEVELIDIARLRYNDYRPSKVNIRFYLSDFNFESPSPQLYLSNLYYAEKEYSLKCTVKLIREVKPQCGGPRYVCRDRLTGNLKCCHMGNH